MDSPEELLGVVRSLREAERYDDYVAAAITLARAHPDDVMIRIEAAYACDSFGSERDAITHYDAAAILGVPDEERREFLLGYCSTLRNVGRVADALTMAEEALKDWPDDRPLRVFHALALLSAGRSGESVAELLDLLLSLSDAAPELLRYERALAYYRDELRQLARRPMPDR